jgi:hypothetical protein
MKIGRGRMLRCSAGSASPLLWPHAEGQSSRRSGLKGKVGRSAASWAGRGGAGVKQWKLMWPLTDGREDGTRGVVTGEPGLAHTGPIVHHESGNFFVRHFDWLLVAARVGWGGVQVKWGASGGQQGRRVSFLVQSSTRSVTRHTGAARMARAELCCPCGGGGAWWADPEYVQRGAIVVTIAIVRVCEGQRGKEWRSGGWCLQLATKHMASKQLARTHATCAPSVTCGGEGSRMRGCLDRAVCTREKGLRERGRESQWGWGLIAALHRGRGRADGAIAVREGYWLATACERGGVQGEVAGADPRHSRVQPKWEGEESSHSPLSQSAVAAHEQRRGVRVLRVCVCAACVRVRVCRGEARCGAPPCGGGHGRGRGEGAHRRGL